MKYFAYGSNMLTEWLRTRVPSAVNPTRYALRKHRLRFHKKSIDCSGKCNVVATGSEADVVHGVLFDIDNAEIAELDKAEGVGCGYRRDEITLLLDGLEIRAFVYVAEKDAIGEALVPYRWYYDLVVTGSEQHSLPSDYVAGLRAIPFAQDPEPDRRSRLAALKALKQYADSKSKV